MAFNYLGEITRKVEIGNHYKYVSQDGYVYLMCPECGHMTKCIISSSTIIDSKSSISKQDMLIDTTFSGECKKCSAYVTFDEIDANIAKTIKILNRKGYRTEYCCEGHIESDAYDGRVGFAPPYIFFSHYEYTKVLKLYPLPETWVLCITEDKEFIIRDKTYLLTQNIPLYNDQGDVLKECVDATLDDIKEKWDKAKSLEDIYNWAKSLPNILEVGIDPKYKYNLKDYHNIATKDKSAE
jgi:hypothetical protein